MAEVVVVETEVVEEKRPNPVLDMAHKSLWAGLGAAAYTGEEVENVINKLVERGEEAEKEGRKRLKELMERRKAQAEKRVNGAQSDLEDSISRALHSMNVPTKADIDALNAKVTLLTKKVDALLKEKA